MKTQISTARRPGIQHRIREIQASWSPKQRSQRAQGGIRRRQQLFALLEVDRHDPGIWAVGAPQLEDSPRIAS